MLPALHIERPHLQSVAFGMIRGDLECRKFGIPEAVYCAHKLHGLGSAIAFLFLILCGGRLRYFMVTVSSVPQKLTLKITAGVEERSADLLEDVGDADVVVVGGVLYVDEVKGLWSQRDLGRELW